MKSEPRTKLYNASCATRNRTSPGNAIKVFDHTVLEAVGKVHARIEELRQAKGDRQQLELKFGDAIVGESPTGVSFSPLSPVRPPLGHQNIADSVVSC